MNTLISEAYRETQKELHKNAAYGVASVEFAPLVASIMNQLGVRELLDYGAGKQRLAMALRDGAMVRHRFDYRPYEPADDTCSASPEPAEMVTCIDVLEHIEPEYLEDVLDDLQRLTRKVGLFTIHCGAARKVLPDGRNAHLTQQPMRWWLPRILDRFDVDAVRKTPGGFCVMVTPRQEQ